jgi:trans-aconitate methyltransferase
LSSSGKWDAGLYDTKHSFVWENAGGVVDLLAAKPGEQILDLGCGTGTLTAEIAASGAQVVGLDRSAEMIAEARKKFPAIEFEVCDARELRFSEQFDAVFSNAALHWIPEAEQVVEGVARALRPGGRFVAEFGGKGNVHQVVLALQTALAELGVSREGVNPWYNPNIAEYAALLENHGLEVTAGALFERPTKLEDGEQGLRNWITMFCGSFLQRVPAANREKFLAAAEAAARTALWKPGYWELDYRRLRIAAVRAAR